MKKKIIVLLLTAFLLFSCDFDTRKIERIEITGGLVETDMSFSDFSEIVIAGPFDVVLDQDGGNDVHIETYASLMELVRAEIIDDALVLYVLDTTDNYEVNINFDDPKLTDITRNAILSSSRLKWPKNEKHLKVALSVGDLEKIQVIGESSIKSEKTLKADDLSLEVAGAVHFDADLDVRSFCVDLAGAGNLDLSGTVRNLEINCAGAGTVKAYELRADSIDLEIAGVCNAQLYAVDNLDVEIAGMGTIKYKGNPSVSIDKAGIGSVKQVEAEENQKKEI